MFHCLVRTDQAKPQWILSYVYGSPHPQGKRGQWEFINRVCDTYNIDDPWILIGDLNLSMHPDERANNFGSSSRTPHIVQLIHDTGLSDLGFHVRAYTWTSGKNGTGRIKSRIEIAIINP